MPKAYVVLVDDAAGTVHVPAKADVNRATGTPIKYCPGCPAIFGGRIQGKAQWWDTLDHEVTEESVRTYQLFLAAAAQFFYSEVVKGELYSFYVLPRVLSNGEQGWDGEPSTLLPPPPPRSSYAWGEMQAVQAIQRDMIPVGVPLAVLGDALIALTGATPSRTARAEFLESATLCAFQAFTEL